MAALLIRPSWPPTLPAHAACNGLGRRRKDAEEDALKTLMGRKRNTKKAHVHTG